MTTPNANITAVYGQHDDRTLVQLRDVATRAEKAAIMADGHLGFIMPIGGIAAYDDKVSVAGVGFDIACGNAAIRTNLTPEDVDLPALADAIADQISFGLGRTNRRADAPTDDPLFSNPAWDAIPRKHREKLRDKAREQLGTVGGGNHYVDVLVDEAGRLWIGVHFGSRGLGHTIASNVMALAQNQPWGTRVQQEEALLDLDTPLGHDYWHLMNLAGEYAYAGREWVARTVVQLVGGEERELVHNHHNFAWKERHIDRDYIVVRKGATPAFPGQKGFVGGSMGDDAVILRGVDVPAARDALYSTVHGAGRVMSRTQAAGKWDFKQRKRKTEGAITQEGMHEWLAERGVILRGGWLDEAPQAYRRLPDVIAAQGETVEVLHTLRPLVVVMAGKDVFDPYKD